MATTPYFVLSPSAVMSFVGLIRGPDKTEPTPAEDWHSAKVDVVIPALNEESNIALCLDGLRKQTFHPRKVLLIDDGSTDRTVAFAEEFCAANNMPLTVVRRHAPIGKTPTIKRQARELDSDVEFILDADTILESPEYIARTVEELYKAVGIASACGNVMSLSQTQRKTMLESPAIQTFAQNHPDAPLLPKRSLPLRLQMGLTSTYRDCLYTFLQRFVYRGQMVFHGTITHPVGCAVAYRRKYIQDLFDKYEPVLDDDLTNSEDIFIGFALLNEGYRNIQLGDVYCRSQEPPARKLPHQLYMWSSSFLQSCFYFDALTTSPLRWFKRWKNARDFKRSPEGKALMEKRKVQEPYRQPFGEAYTRAFGRPAGWGIMLSLLEKISFPTVIVWMLFARMWEPLAVTVAAETAIALGIMTVVAPPGHKAGYLLKGFLVTPVRYGSLLFDITTLSRFACDLWIRKNRKWRK